MSQQFLRRSKDRQLGLEPNSFSDGRQTDDGDSSRLGIKPNSFSFSRWTDACDLSRIGLEPNSFAVSRRTDVWELSRLGLKSMGSSGLGLESINSFGHILCKEVPCLTFLGTRELTHPRRICAIFRIALTLPMCTGTSVALTDGAPVNGDWCDSCPGY